MKTIGLSFILCCLLQATLVAQTNSQPASNVAATVIARSASSRIWARISSQTNIAGEVSLVTNTAYTELGSGLCYQQDGQWVDSVAQINIVADGAAATQTLHKVHFAGNANTAGGAVHLVAPDGKVFDSRVYGLAYWDSVSGTSVLLAPLQDCQGTLVGSNRIVYADAFQGLKADIEYLVTKAGLEQNVLLRERLPAPESVGAGLSSGTTRLEVLSEFFSPPAPARKRSVVANGVQDDRLINFGAMGIGMGKAFFTQGGDGAKAVGLGRVAKHWTTIDGRYFLVEEIPYAAISNAVQNLPVQASAGPLGGGVKHLAALEPLLPKEVASTASSEPMKLSEFMPAQPGLVVDYTEYNWADYSTNDTASILFQSDTTYWINGDGDPLCFYQPVTFEGGTVVKFEACDGNGILNEGENSFNFNGSAYRPVVLTAASDCSVGEPLPTWSGTTPWAGTANYLIEEGGGGSAYYPSVTHVRFCYAMTAYEDDVDSQHYFGDCQFVQCSGDAIYVPNDEWICLENDLFSGCGSVIEGQYLALDAENITADGIGAFAGNLHGYYSYPWGGPYYEGSIINSILSGCGQSTNNFSLDHTLPASDSGGIYQGAGDGSYYLAANSPYRNAGTTSIDSYLLAELQTKTTCPPTVFASTAISGSTNFGVRPIRDTCYPGPDYGYHYDPLDWAFGGTTVNGNLAFGPGTAVGWFNSGLYNAPYGIQMGNGMVASFQGAATVPVWWVRCNTVQEEDSGNWPGAGAAGLVGQGVWTNGNILQSPRANLFFTRCSILAGGDGGLLNHFTDYAGGYLIVNAAHSEFYGGMIGGYALSCFFTNCLMDRMGGGQFEGYPGDAYVLQNCTWHGGWLTLSPNNTGIPLVVRDTSFDGTLTTASGYATSASYANYNYNAFVNSANGFPIGGTSDVAVSGGFNWQGGGFGNYYLPDDSPLIAHGDVAAGQVGLYYFTTQTIGAPEGNSIVDIGYHYVALDDNWNPLANGSGQPYYLIQTNGNLMSDPGGSSSTNPVAPIQFTIAATNQYVNNANVPLQLTIQSGVPYYWAVMLDSTNFSAATWAAYISPNITPNLGATQGWHTVWVGLCGFSGGAPQTWNAICLDLQLTAPILVVTNATNVTIPMLQLQGYANEELTRLTFDLTNANGRITNQTGYMTGVIFDTNSLLCTNSAFECLDLVLASGVNTVTLHATDRAGNLTTSNFIFNLNYSNKPAPVIQLYWPQNGTQIGGGSFTWRGTVDDPTVALSAQISDTNGDTNVVAGVIERNGTFWVDNIPLFAGSNSLTLSATDINNHTTTTNITVVESSVALRVAPVADDLNQPTVTVTGTINTSNYTVWVNGVAASQSGTAPSISWTAGNVPVNGTGSAVIQARAIPNTPADNYGMGACNGGGGTNSTLQNPGNPDPPDYTDAEINQARPAEVYCSYFQLSWGGYWFGYNNTGNALSDRDLYTEYAQWSGQTGGTSEDTSCTTQYAANGSPDNCHNVIYQNHWDTNGNELILLGVTTNGCGMITNMVPLSGEDYAPPFSVATGFAGFNGQSDFVQTARGSNTYVQLSAQSATTTYRIKTGGRSLPGRKGLHAIAANAVGIVQPFYESAFDDWLNDSLSTTNIPPQQVTIGGQPEGTDGIAWTVLADGQDLLLPISVSSATYYVTSPADTKYPQISFTGFDATGMYWRGWDATDTNIDIIVGQQVSLTSYLGEGAPDCSNFSWTVPSTAESQFFVSTDDFQTNGYPIALASSEVTNTDNASFFWADGATNGVAKTVAFTAVVFGQTITSVTTFNVYRPKANVTTQKGSVDIGYEPLGDLALRFGNPTNEAMRGILFSNTITMPNGLSTGSSEWVQLIIPPSPASETISNSPTDVITHFNESVGMCLDKSYPYPNDSSTTASDSPALTLSDSNEIGASNSQTAEMWLMFQPDFSANWVPLWIVTWTCNGAASGLGTSWSTTGTNNIISVSQSTDSGTTYPIWTNNAENFPWVPPF